MRYVAAFLFTMGALALTSAFKPFVQLDTFDLFQGAVFLSAWYGGLGPGVFSALLSTIATDIFLIPPFGQFSFAWKSGVANIAVFWIVALITSTLQERLKRATEALERAHDELEDRVRARTLELLEANERLSAEITERKKIEQEIIGISGREQHRLGQDLHDGVCQTLAGARLLAGAVRDRLATEGRPETHDLERIEQRLQETLAQAESVARGLYHVEIESYGLLAGLEDLAAATSSVYNITCRCVARRPVPSTDTVSAIHLYRIAQEAVANALKHGKASDILLRVFSWTNRLVVVIADRGTGLDSSKPRNGMGLKMMNYRARMMNGSLEVRSRQKGGTLVACRIPLKG